MKIDEQHQIRNQEGPVKSAPLGRSGCGAVAAGEHHQQSVILAGVVPWAPVDVEREDPGQQLERGVRQDGRQYQQCRSVNGEDAVLGKIFARAVGAVDGGHEVGIVKYQRERVKNHGQTCCAGLRQSIGEQQQRRRPGPAADNKIKRGRVKPASHRAGRRVCQRSRFSALYLPVLGHELVLILRGICELDCIALREAMQDTKGHAL